MYRSQSLLTQAGLKPKIEIRRINANKEIGRRLSPTLHQLAPDTQQLGQMPEHLHQPHNR